MVKPIAMPTNPRFQDLTGQTFFRITVIAYAGNNNGRHFWSCQCKCGRVVTTTGQRVKKGGGCRHCGYERVRRARTIHGGNGTDIYAIWQGIVARCTKTRCGAYPQYGGRGIRICKRWLRFENFRDDIGPRPSKEHTIERKDNDGPYAPWNCVWDTRKAQARNTRRNHLLTFRGETRCIAEWADVVGIPQDNISERINRRGWSVERALTTPLKARSSKK